MGGFAKLFQRLKPKKPTRSKPNSKVIINVSNTSSNNNFLKASRMRQANRKKEIAIAKQNKTLAPRKQPIDQTILQQMMIKINDMDVALSRAKTQLRRLMDSGKTVDALYMEFLNFMQMAHDAALVQTTEFQHTGRMPTDKAAPFVINAKGFVRYAPRVWDLMKVVNTMFANYDKKLNSPTDFWGQENLGKNIRRLIQHGPTNASDEKVLRHLTNQTIHDAKTRSHLMNWEHALLDRNKHGAYVREALHKTNEWSKAFVDKARNVAKERAMIRHLLKNDPATLTPLEANIVKRKQHHPHLITMNHERGLLTNMNKAYTYQARKQKNVVDPWKMETNDKFRDNRIAMIRHILKRGPKSKLEADILQHHN